MGRRSIGGLWRGLSGARGGLVSGRFVGPEGRRVLEPPEELLLLCAAGLLTPIRFFPDAFLAWPPFPFFISLMLFSSVLPCKRLVKWLM